MFPDNYIHPSGLAQPIGINNTGNAGWNGNNYSANDFALIQSAGGVFLPATNIRVGASVIGNSGNYWSASCYNSANAYLISFEETILMTDYTASRYYGFSVRLVCSAN